MPMFIFGQLGWEKSYDIMDDDGGYCTQQTNDGGYIVYGKYNTCQGCSRDSVVTLIKTDSLGIIEWNRNYIGRPTWGENIQQTTDGGYIFTTLNLTPFVGFLGITIIKTYADGIIEWTKDFGSANWGSGSIKQTNDGGYIVSGGTVSGSTSSTLGDVFLIKLNSVGDSIWGKLYGGVDSWEMGNDVEETIDGGYIICGTQNIFAGWNSTWYSDIYLIKTNNLGDTSWTKTLGRVGLVDADASGKSISQTNDNGYIICGNTEDVFGFGDTHAYVIKTDSLANIQFPTGWEFIYPLETGQASIYDYYAYSIQQTNDSNYIMTGETWSGVNNTDMWLAKLTSNGWIDWDTTFGGIGYEDGRSVQQTTDGGFIITGVTNSFGNNSKDIYLIKTDGNGSVPTYDCINNLCTDLGTGNGMYATLAECQATCNNISIATYDCVNNICLDLGTGNGMYATLAECQAICSNVSLDIVGLTNLEIFPNPSNNLFNITFSSDRIKYLRIKILSSILEEVMLVELNQFEGKYSKQINLSNNNKGIYLLEIETNYGKIHKKIILQ